MALFADMQRKRRELEQRAPQDADAQAAADTALTALDGPDFDPQTLTALPQPEDVPTFPPAPIYAEQAARYVQIGTHLLELLQKAFTAQGKALERVYNRYRPGIDAVGGSPEDLEALADLLLPLNLGFGARTIEQAALPETLLPRESVPELEGSELPTALQSGRAWQAFGRLKAGMALIAGLIAGATPEPQIADELAQALPELNEQLLHLDERVRERGETVRPDQEIERELCLLWLEENPDLAALDPDQLEAWFARVGFDDEFGVEAGWAADPDARKRVASIAQNRAEQIRAEYARICDGAPDAP